MPTSGNSNYDKLLEYFEKQKMSLQELEGEYAHLLESIWSHETSLERVTRLQEEVNDLQEEYNVFLNEGNNKKIVENYEKRLKKIEKIKEIEEELNKLNSSGKLHTKKAKTLQKGLKKLQDDVTKLDDKLLKLGVTAEEAGEKHATANSLQIDLTRKLIQEQKELNKRQEEGVTILDDWAEVAERNTKALRKGAGEVASGAKKIFESVTKTLEPWRKANHEAMAYAKTMGMSQKTADAYLNKTVSWAAKNNIGILFNKSTDELIKMQGKYSEVLGRNVQLTDNQKKDMLAMETFLGEDGMMDIANNLENFGLGMSDSADFVKKTLDEATKSGIAASKLTKTIRENIKMAQNYTFKNGLDGLTSMAKKAIELKTDMSLINSFAEKTSTVEGAITTGAQLQVLGGSYALGSDPLSMMYESLNDVEGLFDRAVNMAKGKVYYDEKTGNFEMGAMDRYMMKQAATAMGVDPSKMMDVAYRQASLSKIEGQARLNSNIAGDDEMMELVKNLATWDKGKAVVNIGGKDVNVKDLTSADKEKLEQMQRTDSQNLQEMAISLRSMEEIMSGTQKEINNEQANLLKGIGEKFDTMLGNNTKFLNIFAKGGALFKILDGGWGTAFGFWTVTNGLLRMLNGSRNIFGNGTPSKRAGGTKGVKPRFGQKVYTGKNGKQYIDLGGGKVRRLSDGKVITGNAARGVLNSGNTSRSLGALGGKFGAAASKGLKIGGAALGVGLTFGSELISGGFKKDLGHALGRTIPTSIATIVGTYFGGPIGGMIAGGLTSAVTAGIQKWQKHARDKMRDEIANRLSTTNPMLSELFSGENALQGNYSNRQLKKIEKALEDNTLSQNELNNPILSKARANGDLERIRNQGIDVRVPLGKGGIIQNKTFGKGGILEHGSYTKENGIQNKTYANGGVLEGKSHSEGGMPILGSNIVVEGGEYVINKEATQRNLPLLEKINTGQYRMTAKEPLGKQMTVHRGNTSDASAMPHNCKVEIPPVSLDLSGTIKLDVGGAKQIDITNDLVNNPLFVQRLTDMISKQINIYTNDAYNKGKHKQKFI